MAIEFDYHKGQPLLVVLHEKVALGHYYDFSGQQLWLSTCFPCSEKHCFWFPVNQIERVIKLPGLVEVEIHSAINLTPYGEPIQLNHSITVVDPEQHYLKYQTQRIPTGRVIPKTIIAPLVEFEKRVIGKFSKNNDGV